ncbi:major facilitator superfamily domain-containing protein [Tribonema minus]|uniref:Major facilitator superfamily domain-containing protein n=1 Tax=Tribonema minus TaxID=303371 RepID=A0A836CG38_9STRA|nr:major facilitator superfamily domain-containing protein [Tribonema minus]
MAQAVSGKSKYVLLLLLLIYINNQWTRYLLNYLYSVPSSDVDKSLAAATGITTADYGLLVGFGFSLTYVVVGLVMGRAADVCNRVNIICAGLLIWNAAVVLMGMARDFRWLLGSRIVLGIGEAFSGPASYSLIADLFPLGRRAEANGVFAFGIYVGGGMGSLSLAMAMAFGWRATCYAAAASGGALALLTRATVREPPRSGAAAASLKPHVEQPLLPPPPPPPPPALSLAEAARAIAGRRLVVALMLASCVRFMAGYSIGSYMPVFYRARFPDDAALYSYLNASVVAVGGALSAYFGGLAADKWGASGQRRANLLVPAIGAAAAVPALALALYAPSFGLSMAGLFLEYLAAECWFGPAMSALQGALPAGARATGVAAFTLATTLAGSAAAWAVGVAVVDESDAPCVATAIMTAAGGAYAACAALFVGASLFVRADGYEEITAQPQR